MTISFSFSIHWKNIKLFRRCERCEKIMFVSIDRGWNDWGSEETITYRECNECHQKSVEYREAQWDELWSGCK